MVSDDHLIMVSMVQGLDVFPPDFCLTSELHAFCGEPRVSISLL